MATTADKMKQTAALVALTEQGLTRNEAGRVLNLSKAQVDRALDDARLELVARAQEYVDLHLQAARVAAEKGKSAPMEWALERMGVVSAPVAKAPEGPKMPIIKIGIMLPGLTGSQPAKVSGEVVEASVEE